MNLDWVIIGGGIHGVHVAVVLLRNGVRPKMLRIVDPHAGLLDRWSEVTRAIGMSFLRSPIVHHVDYEHDSLWNYGRRLGVSNADSFLAPYQQPSYGLFQAHAFEVVRRHELESRHVRARALGLTLRRNEVEVATTAGPLAASRVVLAVGAMEEPAWPAWARQLRERGGRVAHVYDHDRVSDAPVPEGPVAIIGGGLTAVQYALANATAGRKHTVLSRHPLKVHQFDSDAGWMGPRHLAAYHRTTDYAERRAIIRRARFRGSVPYQVQNRLKSAGREEVEYRVAEVVRATADDAGGTRLELTDGSVLEASRVVLATGFATACPGGALVRDLAGNEGLPRAPCGFPVVDRTLAWHPRVTLTGPLAELELGPTARNIAGARAAGRLIEATL